MREKVRRKMGFRKHRIQYGRAEKRSSRKAV
jgi:hypothetical protein